MNSSLWFAVCSLVVLVMKEIQTAGSNIDNLIYTGTILADELIDMTLMHYADKI